MNETPHTADFAHDDEGPYLPGHHDVSYNLGTPRQYTARGGWNIDCECGVTVGESGDEDFQERWLRHLSDVLNPPGEQVAE